ncbi:MAG: hypothetical protein HOP33_06605 [Verrucomicrobia bacterium]|nr:hypothetical protein [Verrucomicrobiota bacterium]
MRPRRFNSISLVASCLLLVQHGHSSAQSSYTAVVFSQTNVSVLSGFGCSFGQYVGTSYDGTSRAILWSGSFSNALILGPSGTDESFAFGVSDGQQIGYFLSAFGAHAALWNGTAESMVDLDPGAFGGSVASAVHNGVQVGYGSGVRHALLWRGSAASVIDLHPTNANPMIQPYYETFATCVAGRFQGGYGTKSDSPRALMWTGTRQSVIELSSGASKVAGISCSGTAVGFVFNSTTTIHATMWHGNATSFVDLNPTGFASSQANAISGNVQVGSGARTNQPTTALVWFGTPESVIELQQFLPPEFVRSEAMAIDEFGNILGHASRTDATTAAILWVPEVVSGSAPTLKIAPWCEAGGKVKLQIRGEAGRTYGIQKSSDLLSWTTVMSTNFPTFLFYFQDLEATNSQTGFYRAFLSNQP